VRRPLELAAVGDAGLDPRTAFEQPYQQGRLRSAMNPAGVLAALDEQPRRDTSVLVLVRRESELQGVDPMGER
jgi:hypothetical protein